jgi:hypothetical protein
MNANGQTNGWIDSSRLNVNRNKVPLAELQKYAGQWVAWSGDGTRIVASYATLAGLCDVLDQQGIDTMSVVLSEIHADEVGQG